MREKLAILISIILAISFISPVMGGSQISDEVTADSDPSAMPLALIGKKICVDPGHGGSDTGTTGIDGPGYPDEKDHNLDMGLRLRDLLEAKGASVYMTRTTDVDVSLQGRCDIANNNNTDIFVSIHCNSVGVETVSGTETFYWGVDAVTYSVNGKRLAENVQSELVDHLGSNDRGAKADFPYFGFHLYVLDHTIMPAILTEVGFMSNQTEFDLLNQTWYRQEAAQAMFDGIMTYYRSSHAPIRINSNAEFAAMALAESWQGDGSSGNPYVIENYDINGTGAGCCIYIGNTTEYFVIQECILYGASGIGIFPYFSDCGLNIYNVWNGSIMHNTVFSNAFDGIVTNYVYNSSISHNEFTNNYRGLGLRFSENNTFHNNTIKNSLHEGLSTYYSTHNIIADNIIDNNDAGIMLSYSENITIIRNHIENNTHTGIVISTYSYNVEIIGNSLSRNWDGMWIQDTSGHRIISNTASNNIDDGFHIWMSNNLTLNNNTAFSNGEYAFWIGYSTMVEMTNNSIVNDGLLLTGDILNHYNLHNIDTSNTQNGNPIYYLKNLTSGGIPNDAGQIILANCTGMDVNHHNIINGEYALILGFSNNNTISDNSFSNQMDAIRLDYCYDNMIINNSISFNDCGAFLWSSYDNYVYHNNFTSNMDHARDFFGINNWNASYPIGGNYWSDYSGLDVYSGPNQDIPGSDGLGDSSETFSGGQDYYPLMSPFEYTESDVPLQEGWNLISLPTRQLNWSIDSVLESIDGKWNGIRTYNVTDSAWYSNIIYRPAVLNDLNEMNHLHGYWVNITEPGVTLTVKGDKFNSTLSIPLYTGWNLLGYPSLVEKSISDALAGTGYDRSVEGFDGGAPYHISQLLDTYMMKPGEGYWVHVPADTTWIVDW